MLRSLKFVRKLNISPGGRRLGSTALQRLNETRLLRPQPLASLSSEERNYVTNITPKQNYNNDREQIDLMLNEMDRKIKFFGNIYNKDVENVLNAATASGSITSTQGLLLIRCCGEFLSSESTKIRQALAKTVWDTITALGVQLDISHYNALLLVNLENETDFSPLDILMELQKNNIQPNRVTFQRLIEQYCNKGDIAGATKILEHMSAQEIPINEIIFNSLIRGHSEAGNVENALKTLEIMEQAGIPPTSRSYTAVLCMYAKNGDIDAIRNTLDECKEKDISLANREILEIIYTLAINNHTEHINEMMSLLQKGSMYNKETIPFIYKLVEKNCLDASFKLLKSLVNPPNTAENENFNSGRFFIRKMILCDTNPESIVNYCKIMQDEGIHKSAFIVALHIAFTNDKHHLALPLLKALKESGADIREHYFYPLFVSFNKAHNLQGLLNTMKTMIFDFNITPMISTVKDYIIPFMVENNEFNCHTLVENNLPFSIAANAMLLHLLQEKKTQQAAKFCKSTYMTFNTKLIVPPLVSALGYTKDAQSIVTILHHQYARILNEKNTNNNENAKENMSAHQLISDILTKATNQFSKSQRECIIEVLQGFSEKGINIDEATAENVKLFLGEDLTPEIKNLIDVLVSGDLTLAHLKDGRNTNSFERLEEKAQGSIEFKMLLLQKYAKARNHEKLTNLLEEMEKENPTYTIGTCAVLLDYYTKSERLDEAEKWFNKIKEIDPACKINKIKILNYADLLVKNNRIDDALNVLNCPVIDEDTDGTISCERLLSTVKNNAPNRIEDFFNVLNEKKFFSKVTVSLLGSIIRAALDSDDTLKAVEKFRWACQTYKMTPQRNVLMMKLINNEDAKALQHVTDLCTQIYGEMNALFDLAIAFFDCGRPRQARKILETPGLRFRMDRITYSAQKIYEAGDAERLQNFVKLLHGLVFNLDPLYIMLLQIYEKTGEWDKCLSVWTQMQEDNIQPSSTFMSHLERILKKSKQDIPFASSSPAVDNSQKDNGVVDSTLFLDSLAAEDFQKAKEVLEGMPNKQKDKYYPMLIETCLNKGNIDLAVQNLETCLEKKIPLYKEAQPIVKNIFTKLIEANDFDTIGNIALKTKNYNYRSMPITYLLNTCFYESGKYKELLTYLESILDDPTKPKDITKLIFHNITAARAMQNDIEIEEMVKRIAPKAVSNEIFGPLNTVWIHEYLKGSPEAEKIWDEHLKNSAFFHSISALLVCKERNDWSKIVNLAELLESSNMQFHAKRRTFASYFRHLLDSDEPKKYTLAYECLRHAIKVIGFEEINPNVIKTIEENLPDGLTIEALKTAQNERTQEKATG